MPTERKKKQVVTDEAVSGNGHGSSSAQPSETLAPAEITSEELQETPAPSTPQRTISREDLFLSEDDDLSDETPGLASCPVRQPLSETLFRVRVGKPWRAEALLVDFRDEHDKVPRGKYLVVGDMRAKFKEFGRKVLLLTCVTNRGQVFLWDIKIVQGFGDTWYKSDLNIARMAETHWTRFIKQVGNAHTYRLSKQEHGEPRWPGEEVKDIYDLALLAFSHERLVLDYTHPLCDVYEIEA